MSVEDLKSHPKPDLEEEPEAKRPKTDDTTQMDAKKPEFGRAHNGQTNLKYEYLDHTADIQLHGWGATTAEAFVNTTLAMFDYMTELPSVTIDENVTYEKEINATDLQQLLYTFMDELLFVFSTEFLIAKQIIVTHWDATPDDMTLKVTVKGEKFSKDKHPQGTEVKAITYSAMQIHESEGRTDIYVIVDI